MTKSLTAMFNDSSSPRAEEALLFASLGLIAADTRNGITNEARAQLDVLEKHAGINNPRRVAYIDQLRTQLSSSGSITIPMTRKPLKM